MLMLRAVLFSRFDVHLGPLITLSVPAMNSEELEKFKVVPRLIDLAENDDFFISTLENVYSANYHFSIANENTRGKKDLVLVSIAVQSDNDDDKEKILLFLKKTEDSMREFVRGIIANEDVMNHGIWSRETNTFLKESLHGFFNTIFHEERFDAMFKRGQDRIAIFTCAGLDPLPIIDHFKKQLRKEKRPSLRTRLIMDAMDELSYQPFHCIDRGSDTCLGDRCPVCRELVVESDAAICIYDSTKFSPPADIEDLTRYLQAIDAAKPIPVLVLQVDVDPKVDSSLIYEAVTAKLQDMISLGKLKIRPRPWRVPIVNVDAFKECMSWLIKEII
ncbi:MAG: hypothetical protein Q6365_004785 [Candidatus Sigynarchaeota archaeon]